MSLNVNNPRPLPLVSSYAASTTSAGTKPAYGANEWAAVSDNFDEIGCLTGKTSKPYENLGSLVEAKAVGEVSVEALTQLAHLAGAKGND